MTDVLNGFTKVRANKIKDLKPGDLIKYYTDNVLKHGGMISRNMYPKYIVLANYSKRVTWCVQLTNPTLILFVKPKETLAKEREENKRILRECKQRA
jgi:hypothetical protein